ncbi:MAG: DUF2007 domain-containing protein [Prolixibacteraceae bacterium]|nr:DUF2007 domain-containing protein [Prolixibacteraceae bacterium]
MEKDWKEVFVTDQEYKAEIARDILENNGIVDVILNQKDSAFSSFGSIKVLVPEEYEEKAMELLKDLEG